VLEARDLWVTPPGARDPALRGFSLRVAGGEWVALAGANGSGKTTALLALAGLWPATRGEITLEGRPVRAEPQARDPALAVVMQDPPSQLLQSTVADELAFTSRNLGRGGADTGVRVRSVADELGLTGDLDRDPKTLSAGGQQLVLLAAALVSDPAVLLADEPAAHLDGAARDRALAAVRRRTRGGMAVVWVTQAPDELAAADRVVRLDEPAGSAVPRDRRVPAIPAHALVRVRVSAPAPRDGPRVPVRSELAFDVRPGITALVGRNGSGKSVLLSALAGLVQSHQIVVEWASPPEAPPSLALQFPELQIFEEVVADEVVFAAVSRGIGRDRALDGAAVAFRELGFDSGMLQRRTWTLSTGEKRLVEVVGALIAPSSLVLLDEPTAGLDSKRRSALGDLVERRGRDCPVVIATQDRDWIRGVGGREIEFER
jgi:energy-coupling factor transporter ATP-binding protein EcfA2